MKTMLLGLATLATLVGCVAVNPVNINTIRPEKGIEARTGVGEYFFEQEIMTGQANAGMGSVFYGDALRTELAVRAANKERLVLDYSEYMKPVAGPYGGYQMYGPWLKRKDFDKTLEFDLQDSKVITYKGHQFKILRVEAGKIAYIRVD